VRVSETRATFPDGSTANLSVGPPWWSWLWLGLIYQPGKGTVTASAPLSAVSINALGLAITPPNLAQVVNLGEQHCTNCTSLDLYIHNFGFPLPPWLGGGGFRGIGYRAIVTRGGHSAVLHDHWGTAQDSTVTAIGLPPEYV
jgi:hypothetical protein